MRKIYCDQCGEVVNNTNVVVYKDISDKVSFIFCDDNCHNEFIQDKTQDVFINEKGIIEE